MIKNKKLRIAIASVIMALIYPLIFIIFFCFLKSSDGVDAAGSGIESFYIFIEAFVVSVVYFGISIKFSRAFLHTTNPPYIALLLLLLVFCISLIPGFIDSLLKNDIVYYEDGRIMQKGKKKKLYNEWVGWVKSYRRNGTIWKEEKYPGEGSWDSLIYAKYYYGDGTLKSEGYTFVDDLSTRAGEWKFYKSDGSLDDIRTYDKNNLRLVSSKKIPTIYRWILYLQSWFWKAFHRYTQ